MQESVPSRALQGRYFVKWAGLVVAVLAMVVAAVLVRTYTSIDSTIRNQALEAEKAEAGAFVVATPQSSEASPEQETSRITAEGLQSNRDERLEGVGLVNEVEAEQASPTGGSRREIMGPKAEMSGGAAKQGSSSVAVGRDSAGDNKDNLYSQPTRPRRVISTRSHTIVGHLKRSGQEMKKAGEHFGSGAKHFGQSGTKAGVWTGKKVGLGAKRMGTAFK